MSPISARRCIVRSVSCKRTCDRPLLLVNSRNTSFSSSFRKWVQREVSMARADWSSKVVSSRNKSRTCSDGILVSIPSFSTAHFSLTYSSSIPLLLLFRPPIVLPFFACVHFLNCFPPLILYSLLPVEYVTCKTCKSPDTLLTKENRIFFMSCESCGSRRSVNPIKSGFQAQVGKRSKNKTG